MLQKLCTLKDNKAPDPDSIHSYILKYSLKPQHDIYRLMQWSGIWLLRFKLQNVRLSVSNTMRYCTLNVSTDLEIVNEEKDLGAWCTSDLKPSVHCQKGAVTAAQVLRLIRRSFKLILLIRFLYKMYIQPHQEYCVQVWSQGY